LDYLNLDHFAYKSSKFQPVLLIEATILTISFFGPFCL